MKKTTPKKLSKKLAQYGTLSLAIGGLVDVNGQIVYTDVNPDVGGANVTYELDLNKDGIVDFEIINNLDSSSFNDWLAMKAAPGNSIIGQTSFSFGHYFYFAKALNFGTIISQNNSSWYSGWGVNANSSYFELNYSNCIDSLSQWCDVTDKYLGLRFQIDGNTHYGWARLDVALDQNNWILKDYAYNSGLATGRVRAEGASIKAGEGGPLGIDDNLFSNVKITALNKTIALFNLPQSTNYRLFSLAGQSILDGKIVGNTYVIEANTLSNGVYILELKDENSKGIIRKKIVL